MKELLIKSGEYEINLNLRSNMTIINGETATGKSFFYDKMRRVEDRDDIICINYENVRPKANYDAMVNTIKQSKDKIFVIDQADDIQRKDASLMYAINMDSGTNTFIVIGRKPKLIYNMSDIAEMDISNNKIKLKYSFDEPLV